MIQKNLLDNLTYEFSRITDRKFAERNRVTCKVSQTSIEDYLYRIIPINSTKKIITSIRFEGLDLDKPFVEIVAKNFMISDSNEWIEIVHQVGELYSIFKPRYIRFFDGIESITEEANGFIFDQWYLAGHLSTIKKSISIEIASNLRFQISKELSFYKNYENAFQQLVVAAKGTALMVQLESKETLNNFIKERQVIEVFADNEWAGFIAVKKDNYKYFNGYVVYEEILLDKFKGKGIGKSLQRKMIEHLPSNSSDLLYGTIDHKNTPSWKTAIANGRYKVGKFVYCKIN